MITIGSGIAAVGNVVGNIILVPVLGLTGAAVVTLATFLLVAGYYVIRSRQFYAIRWQFGYVLPCVGAAMVMTIVCGLAADRLLALGTGLGVASVIVLGGVVYGIGCVGLRVFGRDDWSVFRASFGSATPATTSG